MERSEYVFFVDGLRAIAVTSVVAYHAGLPGISGGFVGVDVFFVISGYLIISQIMAGLQNNSFSFKTFWARRALRILPPYLLVVAASCAIAAHVLVMPSEISDFGWQVVFSATMVVNHYFLEQQGYFDTSADLKPLLHLWSLAVEEQFYVIAPLVLVGLAGFARRFSLVSSRSVVAVLFIASLAGCIWLTDASDDKNHAFFLMPLRAWEFIAGGAVGLLAPVLRHLPRSALEALGALALAGLLASILTISAQRPWPFFYAIAPVAATTALIAVGLAEPTTLVARLLSLKPFTWVGLVSYSWYLWHWPLMAFARIYNFEALPLRTGLAMAGISFLLACLTYRLVEQPAKNWRRRTAIDRTWKPLGIGATACAAFVVVGLLASGPVVTSAYASLPKWTEFDSEYPAGPCVLNFATSSEGCLDEAADKTITVLFGDSHARAVWRELDSKVQEAGGHLATLISSGCPALFDVRKYNASGKAIRSNCLSEATNGRALIGGLKAKSAVIATRWLSYTAGVRKRDRQRLGSGSGNGPAKDQEKFFEQALMSTIKDLKSAGVDRILILAPTPEFSRDPASCVLRSDKYGIGRETKCSASRKKIERSRKKATALLQKMNSQDVRIVDPINLFCDAFRCYPYESKGTVLYRDKNHFNDAGVRKIMATFHDDFAWIANR